MDFQEIHSRFSPGIFRLCMAYVNDADIAKDLTQETFISVWQNLNSFRNEAAIGTWIFRIASNKCLRSIEKEQRFTRSDFPTQIVDDHEPEKEERITALYKNISELAEVERIIISLELEDVPQSEIATIVGISESNVRVKIHRIKEKLILKMKHHE